MMAPLMLLALLSCSVCTYINGQTAEEDLVKNLPGYMGGLPGFEQYSGYFALDGVVPGSIQAHYWFVTTSSSPATAPVVLWTNGGPGCSGLFGFLTEMGPFSPNADLSLSLNPYAWNKYANMLFIESPCGVGFSYSDHPEDYVASDESTAQLNYQLIRSFFQRFPSYANNSFYLASESYGGHYIPTLADVIVTANAANASSVINFKGFLVGNPYTDDFSAFPSMIETFYGHSLLPKPYYDLYSQDCSAIIAKGDYNTDEELLCATYTENVLDFVGAYNPYALDFDVCNLPQGSTNQRRQLLRHLQSPSSLQSAGYQPCTDSYLHRYLNQPAVKEALHVRADIEWSDCSSTLTYNFSGDSTAPLYTKLLANASNFHILVFSGNDDAVCSTLGTQKWIFNLGLQVSSLWKTYSLAGQVAGYLTQFHEDGLKFLVVRGAGHEVPTYAPEIALDMFQRFLNWNWIL